MFQDNLKTLRKKKGMTQEELAARLNVVHSAAHSGRWTTAPTAAVRRRMHIYTATDFGYIYCYSIF